MKSEYDVIIVGTGVSGLFCALHLPENMKVLMITKDRLENSNSFLAQGGICVLKDETDFSSYVEDTLKAGKYENDKKAVELMIASSRSVINELISYHVDFDQKDGKLLYTKEAAHSTNRILHHADITGKEITSKLLEAAKKRSNIEIVECCELVELMKHVQRVTGIIVYYKEKYLSITAQAVVLATGGIGGIFKDSTNFSHTTGDGVALALKHNIEVEHMNYIQIHPTTLYSKKKGRRFLISEAVRGEGAYLLNENKERFVDELLPRDVVSEIIGEEMNKFHTQHVYLTLKHLNGDYIKGRFPNIYKACLEEGYDLTYDDIPVTPAQHYFMGGIKVDAEGRTSLRNLYAVGETSCTGVHGANRLASNSLLEALVFSKRAAEEIKRQYGRDMITRKISETISNHTLDQIKQTIEEIEAVNKALLLEAIKRKDEKFYVRWCHEQYKCG